MKTLQKLALIIVAVVFSTANLSAQSYNHPVKSAKRLVVKNLISDIKFEAYNGNEIQVQVTNFKAPPKRADGLKELYGGGEDNTGIGLNIMEMDNSVYIVGASKQTEDAKYVIKVPNSIALDIDYSSPFANADNLEFENFENEISVRSLQAGFIFKNVSGPITASSINGNIVATFGKVNQNNPITLTAINGNVDVSLPVNTPANLDLSTIHGSVYTDFDITFDKKGSKSKDDEFHYIGGGASSEGKINNGGVKIKLSSINDDIYLRKK